MAKIKRWVFGGISCVDDIISFNSAIVVVGLIVKGSGFPSIVSTKTSIDFPASSTFALPSSLAVSKMKTE
jgi:hypothetical protein